MSYVCVFLKLSAVIFGRMPTSLAVITVIDRVLEVGNTEVSDTDIDDRKGRDITQYTVSSARVPSQIAQE